MAARVVLVTGTSSGFGHALAAALLARGDRVYGTVRTSGTRPPAGVVAVAMDVTDEASVRRGVDAVVREAGGVDVVVNNAGFGLAGPVEETGVEDARAILDTNFLGVHRVCRAVLPYMRRQGAGHVVNVGSLAGRVGLPFQALYSASKFALAGYSEGLRMEVAPLGIRVSLVEPGDFATAFTRSRRLAGGDAGSPYHARCRRALDATVAAEQASDDLRPFVRTVLDVLERPSSRLRHVTAPLAQRAYAALLPLLPQSLAEHLLLHACGLDGDVR